MSSKPYERVQMVLQELLSEKEHTISPPPSNCDPLFLLLTSKPNLIGFAHLNGEGKKGIHRGFENFKSLYVVNSSQWADLDLTLVFCKSGQTKDEETLWTETELDPYFCRKFVVSLENLHSDLGRLPFIPLHPETVVGLERPPSAQRLMIDCGVSRWLAEALTVPHRLSEKRIVEDCIQSPAGVPQLIRRRTVSDSTRIHREPGVRFKQLEVSNFRAYKQNTKFDLDANLVVLYGPNGLGKTSFFDAIDFVCTGGVMRFDDRFPRQSAKLLKALRHLDAPDHGFVSAQFSIDGKNSSITRTLDDRKNAVRDTVTLNRTDLLTAITKCSVDAADMRVGNLVRLFRATHLFGQEYQSLTAGLRDQSVLPEDTVSRMLAFQDYVEAINKSDRVIRELTQLMIEAEIHINSLTDSLTEKETEVKNFAQIREVMESPESLTTSGRELLGRIAKLLDLSIDPLASIDNAEVKSWRGLLEGRIGWLEGNIRDLRTVRERMSRTLEDRRSITETERLIHRSKESLTLLERRCNEKKRDLDRIKTTLNALLSSETTSSLRKQVLEWLSVNKDEYDRLRNQLARANEERVDYQRRMLELTESIERTRIEVDKEQDSLAFLQKQVTTLDQQCALITSLLPQVQNWISREEDLRRLNSSVVEMRGKLEAATKLLQEETADLNGAETQQSELALTLLAARESQTDLQRTLESALRYVTNQHCPVCGLGHESKEMLENQIRQRIGMTSPSLEAAVTRSREVEARIEKLRGEQIQSQSEIKSLQQEIDSILQTIDALKLEQKSFEQQILQLELDLDKNNLAAELNARLNTLVYELEEKRNDIVAHTSQHDAGRKHLASLMADETELKAENNAKEVLSQRLSSTINKIESEALSKQVSLNENVTSVNDELSRLNKTLKELQGSLQAERLLVSKTETEYAELQNERSQHQQQIDSLTQRLSQLADSISAFEAELSRLGLEKAVKLEELDSIILASETSLSGLELIKAELLRFELALDEVQLSAQLSKLNQEIDDLQSELRKLKSGHAHVNEWQVYFTKLKEELGSVQRRSLKNYIEKYGPLTSSIQKRLRAVYGFGELKLQQEKGGIGLRVERKGQKNLAPADFFSEAQLQIVTLSMFLSAVLTQTWSAFAPILLDDPVTHFDDLNAYSFLDVIRGLIDEPGEGPQFIISTCEERLYRLMRQKFAQLNGKALFYEFSSIGDNGPKVERVPFN